MATHKWADIKHKNSPEVRENLNREALVELVRILTKRLEVAMEIIDESSHVLAGTMIDERIEREQQ